MPRKSWVVGDVRDTQPPGGVPAQTWHEQASAAAIKPPLKTRAILVIKPPFRHLPANRNSSVEHLPCWKYQTRKGSLIRRLSHLLLIGCRQNVVNGVLGLARLAPEADGAVGIFYGLYDRYRVHRK
jgi:hypothetical protein